MNDMQNNFMVSMWKSNYNPKLNAPLELVELKQVLEYCYNLNPEDEKGKSGSIFPYVSNKLISSNQSHISSGVVLVDIDHCVEYSGKVFHSFDKLAELLPNLIAINFSYSGNLHAYMYFAELEEADDATKLYKEYAKIGLASFSHAVKKVCDIDFRDIKDALDTHNTNIYQRFFLNYSNYKWNEYVVNVKYDNKAISKMKNEYPMIFKENKVTAIKTTTYNPTAYVGEFDGEKVKVDNNFCLFNKTGYDARTLIASNAYYHFNMDIDTTMEYINSRYIFTQEWKAQLESLVKNNKIAKFYNKDVEKFLFPDETTILEEGQYLSDVLDLDNIKSKYVYIKSGTNTGKTEFVKKYLLNHEKSMLLQMTKALRDGKSQGVEDITFGNWESIGDSKKIHTTIEGFVRNVINIDIENYTVFVDESHLLQDYIDVKYETISTLLDMLSKANKVIFMSATPKNDISLYQFKVLKYSKRQKQIIRLNRVPLRYSKGKGSKESAKYSYINNFVRKRASEGKYVIVFSDRSQESYKKYGMDDFDKEFGITRFNSDYFNDSNVQSILKYNKVLTEITLATKYLGVGVETKYDKEGNPLKEVDMVFCLDEGFDADFIEQCLGRPRLADVINVFFFYTSNKIKKECTKAELQFITACFDAVNITDDEGEIHLNLVAAKGIRLFDESFYNRSSKSKIESLKVSNILSCYNVMSATDIEIFKQLPYKSVEIFNHDDVMLEITGCERKVRYEKELEDYLLSMDATGLRRCLEMSNDEIYESGCPYNDKKKARQYLKTARQLNLIYNIPLKEAIDYFGKIEKVEKFLLKLKTYVKVKRGESVIESINVDDEETITEVSDMSKKIEDKIKKDMDEVEKVMNKEILENLIEGFKVVEVELDWDNDFFSIMGLEPVESTKFFNGECYDECVKGTHGGDRSSKKIRIKVIETNEVKEFESKGECMKWMNASSKPFSKFIKGEKCNLNERYELLK